MLLNSIAYNEISEQITLSGLKNITDYSFGLCSYSFTKRKASNLVKVLGCLHNIKKFSIGLLSMRVIFRLNTFSIGCLHYLLYFYITRQLLILNALFIFVPKYLAEGDCPDRLFKPMPYLKTLNIFEVNFNDLSEVSCLLCLIRSAPNLRKLHISVSH